MKKIWLIALFFNSMLFGFGKNFSEQIKLNLFTTVKLDYEKSPPELLYGGTLTLPFIKASYGHKGEKQSFSFLASSQNLIKGLSISAYTGNLSAAGALSKLNNPALSSSTSSFTSAQTSVNGITLSATPSAGLSKPISHVLQIDFKQDKKTYPKTNAYVNLIYTQVSNKMFSFSDDSLAFSSLLKLSNSKKSSFALSTALGLFPYKENTSSSWFSKSFLDNYYYGGKHYCQNIQGAFSINDFSSSLSTSLYASPFGNYDWTFRNENKVSLQNLTINFSHFYSPSQVFTSSSKIVKETYQAKANLQYNFISILNDRLLLTKAGLGCYYSQKDEEKTYKLSAGVKTSYEKLTTELSGTYDFSSCKIKAKISLNEANIKGSLYGTFAFIPPQSGNQPLSKESSEKFGLNLNLPKPLNLTCSTALSLAQKNGETTKRAASSSINGKVMYKKISINYKLAANFDF